MTETAKVGVMDTLCKNLGCELGNPVMFNGKVSMNVLVRGPLDARQQILAAFSAYARELYEYNAMQAVGCGLALTPPCKLDIQKKNDFCMNGVKPSRLVVVSGYVYDQVWGSKVTQMDNWQKGRVASLVTAQLQNLHGPAVVITMRGVSFKGGVNGEEQRQAQLEVALECKTFDSARRMVQGQQLDGVMMCDGGLVFVLHVYQQMKKPRWFGSN